MAPWQRITIYRYTLPPPYEATEYLFEELPLSTYPSGTTMEPLAYEMAPGAHLGRAAPWNQALVLFPWREPTQMAASRAIGVSFREACDRGYLRPYDPPTGARLMPSGPSGEGGGEGHAKEGRRHGPAHRRMPPEPRSAWGVPPHLRNTSRAMGITFWLPQTEAVLPQVDA